MADKKEADTRTVKGSRNHASSTCNDNKKRIKLYGNKTKLWEQISWQI